MVETSSHPARTMRGKTFGDSSDASLGTKELLAPRRRPFSGERSPPAFSLPVPAPAPALSFSPATVYAPAPKSAPSPVPAPARHHPVLDVCLSIAFPAPEALPSPDPVPFFLRTRSRSAPPRSKDVKVQTPVLLDAPVPTPVIVLAPAPAAGAVDEGRKGTSGVGMGPIIPHFPIVSSVVATPALLLDLQASTVLLPQVTFQPVRPRRP